MMLASLSGLLCLEIFLRAGAGLGDPLLLQKDTDIGYVFRANQKVVRFGNRVNINRFHQRAEDFAFPAAADAAPRILVVGDSVTFGGTGLDQSETITSQLEAQLGEAGQAAAILNASAGSWGLGNSLAYLQKFGSFGARWVVLQIGSHDLLQEKSTSASVGVHPSMPDKRPLFALTEVWSRYVQPRLLRSNPWRREPTVPPQVRFWSNMDDLIAAAALIRAAGGRPLILHTPERAEVVPAGPTDESYGPWRESFLAVVRAERIPVLDLYELWRAEPAAASYFADHVHLTKAGNAAVARHLAEFIAGLERIQTQGATGTTIAGDPGAAGDLAASDPP